MAYLDENGLEYVLDKLSTEFDKKSNTGHTHDDRYYTESEIDSKLDEKASELQAGIDSAISIANIQADWNQNDETAVDYVKNRPFYSIAEEVELLPETTVTFVERYGEEYLPLELVFEEGKQYSVCWNGNEYEVVGVNFNDLILIGNLDFIGFEDTGEPFLIGPALDSDGIMIMSAYAGDFSISISAINESVKTIDQKFLPDIDISTGMIVFVEHDKADKTYEEILSAIASGENVYLYYCGEIMYPSYSTELREIISGISPLIAVSVDIEFVSLKGYCTISITQDNVVIISDEYDPYAHESYVDGALSNKADTDHSHTLSDISDIDSLKDTYYTEAEIDSKVSALNSSINGKVPTTRTVNGKALSSNITLSASDVGADAAGSASSALASAKTYADSAASSAATTVKNDLLNGAGAAYDTLKELGDLISANDTAIDALETVAAGKADKSHTHSNYASTVTTTGSGNAITAISQSGNTITATKGSTFSVDGHKHSAADITSGTLTVGRGGTGVTSNPSMLVNLGSTSAASVFAASPRPGITGTLPIANGGTGATSADVARTNLSVYSIADINALLSNYVQAILLSDDGNGNVIIGATSSAAASAEEASF